MTYKRQDLYYQVNIKRELNVGFLSYQDRDDEREL